MINFRSSFFNFFYIIFLFIIEYIHYRGKSKYCRRIYTYYIFFIYTHINTKKAKTFFVNNLSVYTISREYRSIWMYSCCLRVGCFRYTFIHFSCCDMKLNQNLKQLVAQSCLEWRNSSLIPF